MTLQGFCTLEVRWFESGSIPKAVQCWFEKDCPGERLQAQGEREDLYFLTPGCDAVNLKLRQGNLEMKWRKSILGVRQWGAWQGNVERWLKWSYTDAISANSTPVTTGIWVKKARLQRQDRGVACEVTQLEVDRDRWWTIAFEMLEEDDRDADDFDRVIHQMTHTLPDLTLSARQSYAYPTWLLQQITGEGVGA